MGVAEWLRAFSTPTVDIREWSGSFPGPLPADKELAVHTE